MVKPWSLEIHGGSHMGAAECAFRTAVKVEYAAAQGRHALLAFLDSSKCYERVAQALAAEKGGQNGYATQNPQHGHEHLFGTAVGSCPWCSGAAGDGEPWPHSGLRFRQGCP